MAKRDRNHETGDRGVKIALAAAPDNWVDQEQKKDYGVDIKFELFREKRHSGYEFGVQVRSTERINTVSNGEFVTCELEVENLHDHFEKRRYPVYLFRVDVHTGTVYWICLQRYVLNLKPGWEQKKKKTIRIPVEQTLSNPIAFERELERDWDFVQDLHPGSVSAAVGKLREEYAALDDRFQVDIFTDGNDIRHQIRLLEPIPVKIKVHADTREEAVELLNRPREYGIPSEFVAEFEGSPLLELMGPMPVELAPPIQSGFEITVSAMNGIPVEVRSTHYAPDSGKQTRTQWNWSFEAWKGKSLSSLPGFNAICQFVDGFDECDGLQIELRHSGSRCRFPPIPVQNKELQTVAQIVSGLKQARDIAEHFSIHAEFQLDFDLDDMSILHWLVFDRTERPTSELIINDMTAGVMDRLLVEQMPAAEKSHIRQTAKAIVFQFFDTEVTVGPVVFEYFNIALREMENLPKHVDLGPNEAVMEFCCTRDTTVVGSLG